MIRWWFPWSKEPRPKGPDEAGHHWIWEESSSGISYRWCKRCHHFRHDLAPNQFHDWLECP